MDFSAKKLHEVSPILSAVAMGRQPADLCICGANLVNVCTGEIQPNIDVAVAAGRIALVGDAQHCIGPDTAVIHAQGQYIAPGLLDGHIHIESSMLTASNYAKAVLPRGTTGIFYDPHEIVNVLGLDGMHYMMEDGAHTPLKMFATMPSCVPAVPGFEDTAGAVSPQDVAKAMELEQVVGLGEMMNYPGIMGSDPLPHQIMAETLKAGKTPTGHYAAHETGKGLNAYIASGARCCHESTRQQDALAKMRLGMYAMMREGSAWHDLTETIQAITKNKVDTRYAIMVSDDTHPNTLVTVGHLDHLLRRARQEGLDPVTAIQMVTINVAQCFHLDHDIGSIAPGKCADIIFLDNLEQLNVTKTIVNGRLIAQDGQLCVPIGDYIYPEKATKSMHIAAPLTEADFCISAPAGSQWVDCRVIEAVEAKVYNFERILTMPVRDGAVAADPTRDILKACVIERHNNLGTKGLGLVKGFGIQRGAIASTVSHDAHNLLVVGASDQDMALCANTLRDCGGGMVACLDGQVIGLMPLPVAGLMSQMSAQEASDTIHQLDNAWKQLGCQMLSPFMTMALMALACLPELRLTNRGLVDCRTFAFTQLFVE